MQFQLGRIPVRIRGPFIFLAVVLGAWLERPDYVAIWVGIVFVSVLVHELGHALVGRLFGLEPQIELHGMGGTTSWSNPREIGNARSIAISVAGPFAGFAIAGALLLARRLGFHPEGPRLALAVELAFLINLKWGIFNLAPMLPLDGGNVVRSALKGLLKGRGEKAALIVSMVTCGCFIAYAVYDKQLWLGGLAAFFGWANFQALRQADTVMADAPLAAAIEKAYVALEKEDGQAAIELLRPVIVPQASEELRVIALRVYSYALLIEGMWEELMPTLQRHAVLIGAEELTRFARTAEQLGRATEAERISALVPRPRLANDFG